jgi:hypothetical protein
VNASRDAYAFRIGGGNFLAQAGIDSMTGRNAAFGTILSGAATAGGMYYRSR